jgi:hypothetical protein
MDANNQLSHNDFTLIWRLYTTIFDEPPKHRKQFYTLYSWHGEKLFKTLFDLVDMKLSGKFNFVKSDAMTNQEFSVIDNMCRARNNNTVLTYRLCGENGYRVPKK